MRKQLLLIAVSICWSFQSFAQCAIGESYIVSPAPVNNSYNPGQVVNICYTVASYQQLGANWIHGFVFGLGNGWDTSSIVITQMPNVCSGNGYWGYFNSVTSTGSGQTFGPGVYFDYNNAFYTMDGDPGNNFGDQNMNNACSWTLCFDITVDPTVTNGDLSLSITVTGDGTTGAWGYQGCPGIENQIISGVTSATCNYTVNMVSTNPSCGITDGTITVNISGGQSPFTYQWSTGDTTSSISNLNVGIYNLTVIDATGCVQVLNDTLSTNGSAGVSLQITQPISCYNYCDGIITATPTSGTAPYTYQWSNGTTTSTNSSLCSNTYTVILTDANQCSGIASITLINPSGMTIGTTSQSASCHGFADGWVQVNVQSSQTILSYNWSQGQITPTASNLPAGIYYVTVTDISGCSLVDSAVVSEPAAISLQFQVNDLTCNGSDDGSIQVSTNQGASPYNYLWSNGNTTSSPSSLAVGNYDVTVIDANGCSSDSSTFVDEPTPITINLDAQPATCEGATDGLVSAQAYGGAGNYNYYWSTFNNGQTITNLSPGLYNVTVVDANGCSASDQTNVVSMPQFSVDAGFDVEVVRGYSIGLNAQVDVLGSYNYQWTPNYAIISLTGLSVTINPDTTTVYTIVVTNASGCQATDDVLVTVLSAPTVFIPNAFSPNDDGQNDELFPIPGDNVVIESFRVFNRWGEKLFDNVNDGWDGNDLAGRPSELAVYTYYCEYTLPNGTRSRKQGTALLIR